MILTIAVASDHAGRALREALALRMRANSLNVIDLGVDTDDPVDYPDMALKLAETLRLGQASRGVLVCGSGIGISIAANRHAHIRAALVHDALGARLSRQHNDANVLAFGGRVIGVDVAIDCLDIFLSTAFEGGRHQKRVDKLARLGNTDNQEGGAL